MSESTSTFPPLFARTSLKTHTISDHHVAVRLDDDQLAAVLFVMLQPVGSFFRKEQIPLGYNRAFKTKEYGVIVRRYERLNVAIHTWDSEGKIMPLLLLQLYGNGIDARVIQHYHFDGVFEITSVDKTCSLQLCKSMLDKAEEYIRTFRPNLSWRLKRVAIGTN